MTVSRPVRAVLVIAAALAAAPAAAPAQSLLASRGLGYPLPPLDARSVGLGGVGLGLPGASLSLVNPAAVAGIPAPTLAFAYQPDVYDAEFGSMQTDGEVSRFPLLHAAFPVGRRFTASVGYGSFLDQRWQVQVRDTVTVGGVRRGVTDTFLSDGGTARLRLGAAYTPAPRFAVGVAADVFTGSAERVVERSFDPVAGLPGVTNTQTRSDLAYEGVSLAAGVHWTPVDALHLAAAASTGGELRTEGDGGAERALDVPPTVDVGASGRVAQTLLVALSGRWAGWSSLDDELAADGGARDAASVSGGLEYDGLSLAGRAFPLRLGGRWTQLPFRWADDGGASPDFPDEVAVSAGLGARFAGGAALADAAVERGRRGGDAAGIREDFWRLSFSLTLMGR